jgi:hypothetical protein
MIEQAEYYCATDSSVLQSIAHLVAVTNTEKEKGHQFLATLFH